MIFSVCVSIYTHGGPLFIVSYESVSYERLYIYRMCTELDSRQDRCKATHLTVTHPCGDHAQSCVIWLLRANDPAVCCQLSLPSLSVNPFATVAWHAGVAGFFSLQPFPKQMGGGGGLLFCNWAINIPCILTVYPPNPLPPPQKGGGELNSISYINIKKSQLLVRGRG